MAMTMVPLNVTLNDSGSGRKCLDVLAFSMIPYITVVKKNGVKYVKGVLVELLDTYAKKYGVCYMVRQTVEGYGRRLSNGSFSGMMGEAQRNATDLLLTPLSVMYDRLEAIDFSTSFDTEDHTYLLMYPKREPDIIGFMKPFQVMSWVGVFAALIAMFLVFNILAWCHPKSGQISRKEQSSHSFLTSVGLLLGQAMDLSRFYIRDRILISLWLLTIVIMTTVYKSNLKAMMTAPRLHLLFNSVEELIENDPIPHRMAEGSFIHVAALNSPEGSTLRRLLNTMHSTFKSPPIPDFEEGISTTVGYTNILQAIFEGSFSRRGYCTLTQIKETFLEVNVAIGLPKNRPWKKDLDNVITRIREAGIVSHRIKAAMPNVTYCMLSNNMIQSLRPLVLKDFYGIFGLFLGGILLSLIAFTVEVIHGSKLKNNW